MFGAAIDAKAYHGLLEHCLARGIFYHLWREADVQGSLISAMLGSNSGDGIRHAVLRDPFQDFHGRSLSVYFCVHGIKFVPLDMDPGFAHGAGGEAEVISGAGALPGIFE